MSKYILERISVYIPEAEATEFTTLQAKQFGRKSAEIPFTIDGDYGHRDDLVRKPTPPLTLQNAAKNGIKLSNRKRFIRGLHIVIEAAHKLYVLAVDFFALQ